MKESGVFLHDIDFCKKRQKIRRNWIKTNSGGGILKQPLASEFTGGNSFYFFESAGKITVSAQSTF